MPRRGFWFTVTVKDDERAFLTRDGCFLRLLGPGMFTAFDPRFKLAAEVVKVARAEITPERALRLQRPHPELAAELFEIVQAGPAQVGLVSFDGDPKHLVLHNTTRVFWKKIASTITRVAANPAANSSKPLIKMSARTAHTTPAAAATSPASPSATNQRKCSGGTSAP